MKFKIPSLLTKTSLLFIALASFLQTEADAGTDRYRLSWRDNPATSMVVGWERTSGSGATVYYGTTDRGTNWSAYSNSKSVDRTVSSKGMTHQFARLTGLQPDTAYYFVIRDSDSTSNRFWFKTAPSTPQPFTMVSGGDSRNNRSPRRDGNRIVAKLRPLLVTFGGDYTAGNTNSEWAEWFDDWQHTISSDGRMYPVVPTRGNHDDNGSLVDMFDIPSNDVYFALTIGGSHLRIYTLNSEITEGGSQANWLLNDLSTTGQTARFRMAQYHKPMRPHAGGKSEGNNEYNAWAQVFYDNNMDLVVESDSHMVKRTYPIRPSTASGSDEGFIRDDATGTVYVGEGCWGAPLRNADDAKNWTIAMDSFNQVQWVQVHLDRIEVRTIKTHNAPNIGSVSDGNPFNPPSGIDIWSPSGGSVVRIDARSLDGNIAPVFSSNPLSEVDANEGQSYSASLSDNASDVNGDTLTFSKVSGPAWLNVANSGSLSGTPSASDAGTNSWTVSVSDGEGGSDTATLNINVFSASGGGEFTVFFQNGLNGYTGTKDTYLRTASAGTNHGNEPSVLTDGDDAGGQMHGLLRFDNLGSQIPAGADILSASLEYNVTNGGNSTAFHRMLVDWSESSTWNSMNNGLSADGSEALSSADMITGDLPVGIRSFDVTNALTAWVENGANNYGWALLPEGPNGIDFDSSESGNGPKLTVTYFTAGTGSGDGIKVEAENFVGTGGAGAGFSTQSTSDIGGGQNISQIVTGDYGDYSISLAEAGTYEMRFRLASNSAGSSFVVKQGGTVLATVNEPATGGWQTWTTSQTYSLSESLPSGNVTLRIEALEGSWNMNWFELILVESTPVSDDPVVSFESPPATLDVGENLHLTVNASDSNGIDRVYLFKDGVELSRSEGGAPYDFGAPSQNDPELQNLSAGIYEFRALARDVLGNEGEATITVTVFDPAAQSSVNINFQPASAAVPSGYLADSSAVYGDRGNGHTYGWESAFDLTRDRNSHADQRFDTLNHTQAGADHYWEIALANGDYSVSITGGDPNHDDSFVEFVAEAGTANAVTLASGDNTGVNFISGTQTVTVSDGRLTITNGPNAVNNKINFINIIGDANEGPVVSFESPPTSVLEGENLHLKVNASDPDGIDRVYLYKDGVELSRSEGAAPYDFGLPSQNDAEMQNLQAGTYEFRARAIDTLGNESEVTISITVSAPININFQPASVPVPGNYLADASETFADRGNGYSYGWEVAFDQTRDRNSHVDQRFDTLNHMQVGGDHYWEIELPNGTYGVSITGGDPNHDDSFIEFVAEAGTANEVTLASGDSTGVNFIAGSATVTVSDGRLTISNGPNAVNNKINFIEIGGSAAPSSSTSDSFVNWKTEHTITDDLGDEDKDGISNLLEFALGGDPYSADRTQLPQVSKKGSDFEFKLHRQAASLNYYLEKSTDLISWEPYKTITDEDGYAGSEITISVPAADTNNGKLFLRLRVEQ